MQIYNNRKDPVGMIYQFELLNSAMEHFDLMRVLVLPHICEVLTCQRLVPLVFRKALSDKDRTALKSLAILRNEEPIKVIDRFTQASGLAAVYGDESSLYRYYVLQEVCEEVLCT